MQKYLLTECAAWKASESERERVRAREKHNKSLYYCEKWTGLAWKEDKRGNTVATEKRQNKSYSFIFLMMKNDE